MNLRKRSVRERVFRFQEKNLIVRKYWDLSNNTIEMCAACDTAVIYASNKPTVTLQVVIRGNRALKTSAVGDIYENDKICEIEHCLIDTGAIQGNYLSTDMASKLQSLGEKVSASNKVVCSCINDKQHCTKSLGMMALTV